ncbi:M23 family metallopeptidase [Arenimonas daejeonensis]|uniref:M23 family metallopeptidase n=1 Tax=Arenimonas daejeonensis TaxID=370777 RepID=UPI0011BDDCAA|nr:M23 family metallopeptidase [Arenimonas daejeonensis]
MRARHVLALLLALAAPVAVAANEGVADLVTVRQSGRLLAVAQNRMAGPVEVVLHASGTLASEPPMPLHRVLAAGERAVLAELPADTGREALVLTATPGEPHAVSRDVVYSLPVEESAFELGQGFHGGFSHGDEANRYAVDLIVAEGTAVLAARSGVVMQATSGFREGGTDRSLAGRANLVRVLHDDGSMALYAHMREGGVTVRAGDTVTLGQVLGYAGSTGFSSGPHLHFALQVNGGGRLVSVPFRMIGPDGFLPLR